MRNLPPELQSELQQPVMQPFYLAELEFDQQTVRLWTGTSNLLYNGNLYVGAGNLIGISDISETQELEAKGMTAFLTGIPQDLIATALLAKCRGRPFRLFLGMIGDQGSILAEDDPGYIKNEIGGNILLENNFLIPPYRWFSGVMDYMDINLQGDTHTIQLHVENILITARRSKVGRYTNQDQISRFPNDKGLEFINALQDKEIVW